MDNRVDEVRESREPDPVRSPFPAEAPTDETPSDDELSDDLAVNALAAAQRFRSGPGGLTSTSALGGGLRRRTKRRRSRPIPADEVTWSTAGSDATRDPQRLGAIARSAFAERGWQVPITNARVFTDWPTLVGADIATHCRPVNLRNGELRLEARSTAWATQIRLLSVPLLARLAGELGANVVTRLTVTGPAGPSWRHGYRSVPGARGPRDTYG